MKLPLQVIIATRHHHRHKSSSLLCGGHRVALGTPKRLQGARYVSAAARGVVTLLQPPLVATAVTSADQPAVRRPRSGCSCAGGSTWMATELTDRDAASADCGRRVLGAGDGAAATSHHRYKTSSSSQVIIVSLWRIPGGARDIWASLIFVSFLFTSLVALLKYLPSTNTNNSVF